MAKKNMRKPNRRRFRNTRRRGDFSYTIPARNFLRGMGISVTPMDEEYDPNLIRGVEENDVEFVKEYLRSGECSNIDGVLGGGVTALMLAAEMDNAVMCKVLIDAGANIEARNDNKDTALTLSAMLGKNKALRVLIEEGADVDKQGYDGYTALAQCAENGNLEGAKMLIEAGARTDTKTLGMTPLEIAELEGHTKVASYLRRVEGQTGRRGRNFSSYTDEEGDTLEEKVNIFRRLVYDGMSDPRRIIHWLQYVYGQYVKKLPQGNPDREAIVHLYEVFSYLNGDTNSRPASLAVYKDAEVARRYYDKCIQDLIKRQKRAFTDGLIGFVVNAKPVFTDDGYYQPKREVTDLSEMEKFIQSGANVNAKVNGHSLVWVAICKGQWAIAECLLKHHAKAPMEQDQFGNTAIMIAAIRGYGDIIPLLVDNGGDVSQQTLNGESPLSVSIRDHDADFVKMLIDCGADVNSRNENNYTPLMNAANRGRVDVAQMLIDAGADINVLNDNNETALSIAERRTEYLPECAKVAELLRSVGAKSARTLLIEKDTGRKREWDDESKKYDDIRFDLVTDALYEITPEQYKWADEAAEIAYAIKDNSMLRITDLEFVPYANDPMKFWIEITPATNADKYVVKAAIKGSLPSNVKIVEERSYDNDPTISYALSLI